ncbi:hypothetical protein SCHPADRAFT_888449 [Schizopora paradoxa]|uniref:Uncharacterized protein n=1 Tax=Schizopora paradoxa TaxID=27342 RepID=A0A0H2RUK6_9AGAM|nr:hypothetical protein SCHPADRAFT_888449 [Schizopora paradoxa]
MEGTVDSKVNWAEDVENFMAERDLSSPPIPPPTPYSAPTGRVAPGPRTGFSPPWGTLHRRQQRTGMQGCFRSRRTPGPVRTGPCRCLRARSIWWRNGPRPQQTPARTWYYQPSPSSVFETSSNKLDSTKYRHPHSPHLLLPKQGPLARSLVDSTVQTDPLSFDTSLPLPPPVLSVTKAVQPSLDLGKESIGVQTEPPEPLPSSLSLESMLEVAEFASATEDAQAAFKKFKTSSHRHDVMHSLAPSRCRLACLAREVAENLAKEKQMLGISKAANWDDEGQYQRNARPNNPFEDTAGTADKVEEEFSIVRLRLGPRPTKAVEKFPGEVAGSRQGPFPNPEIKVGGELQHERVNSRRIQSIGGLCRSSQSNPRITG